MAGFTTRPVIHGRRGVVTAGHYLAAQAGMRMLEAGGNAIDAGVAAGFAHTVLEPHNCGIAGETPMLSSGTSGETNPYDGSSAVKYRSQAAPTPTPSVSSTTTPRSPDRGQPAA